MIFKGMIWAGLGNVSWYLVREITFKLFNVFLQLTSYSLWLTALQAFP